MLSTSERSPSDTPGSVSSRSNTRSSFRATSPSMSAARAAAEVVEAALDRLAAHVGCSLRGRRDRGFDLDAFDLELVDALGLVDPLQMALPAREDRHAFGEGRAEKRPGRLGEEDLTASGLRTDARRADDVQPDVSFVRDSGLTRVQADPHADGSVVRPSVVQPCVRCTSAAAATASRAPENA